MSDTLTHGKVGIFHYTLTNDEGATLDSSPRLRCVSGVRSRNIRELRDSFRRG